MKTVALLTLISITALTLSPAETSGDDEAAALHLVRDVGDIFVKADVAAMTRDFMEDYTFTGPRGRVTGRAEDIESLRKREPKIEAFENRDLKVRLHGSTAVVTGHTHLRATSAGKSFEEDFQFTDTLIKDEGRWRHLAVHVSAIPTSIPAPSATAPATR